LVFTDLDGTLLDRRYDLEAAAAAMDSLHDLGCICIPASSKTYDEMVALNKFRKFPSPCIFENGAGLFWPSSAEPESLGRCANEVHDLLDHIRDEHRFGFRTFRDIGCDELCEITWTRSLWRDCRQGSYRQHAATLGRQRAGTRHLS
jgi:predicted mannosyl-3-phosphoglycerate phosphatase (HAD superfamily)